MEQKSSIGGIIGTIIIIAVIVLGGLYFWGKRIEESRLNQGIVNEPENTQAKTLSEAAVITTVSSSDDLDTIDGDLSNTKTDNLGTEVNQ
jgi:hypothetical protein